MPKLTVDRFSFCKIENAVKMLSDGYSRFFLNKYFRRVTSRRKMPQMCSEISRNASHKSSHVSTGQGSFCLWSVVSRWTEDMRHSVFVPILVPRARRFLVTWSYGYEILAILVRNRVWLSRELRECMNVPIVSIQNE